MGDRRMMAAGYFDTDYDPSLLRVYSDRGWIMRTELLKDQADTWPDSELNENDELVWLASVNRYFALVAHPRVPPSAKHAPKLDSVFPQVGIEVRGQSLEPDKRIMALVLRTDKLTLADEPIELELDLYAGPRDRDIFLLPANQMLGLLQLIKYEMSSSCAFCTFQWLANGLLRFLEMIHIVVRDWGVAIIILVLVVRLLLHPITKKAQVNMMVMGKQMQSLQPELEKLKKKYGDDQKRMQTEQMKLYREKGVNPAGMVGGCLPMFLQMPIWIALYAMLFFAIELRHQPAFYGFFQLFGDWGFLGDLSSPDAFIRFSDAPVRVNFPLLSSLDFSTLNILPLIWAVTMYFQQKLTSPPPATEQAAQQQKMMRYMTVLFPVFLYSAPSGLTLYILASTSAGIVDSYMVRKHVKEQEEAGTLLQKKKRKQGGFMDRISKALEEKQRQMMNMQDQNQRGDDSGRGNKSSRRKRK
jgi:YidC/Oxa1 family membrane protein insertase